MKSPLIDVAAILMCILMVVAIGQYYIHKKEAKNLDVEFEEVSADKRVEKFKFESLVKQTE
jgi:hypothetical protein